MSRTIQTIDDLAQLPDTELVACFGALRTAIHRAKRRHADAVRDGQTPQGSRFEFNSFEWRPRGTQYLNLPAQLRPETPIDELSMRSTVCAALKKLGIFSIDDLSAISEQELLNEESIGAKTVNRLREALSRVGLNFLPNSGSDAMPESIQRIDERTPATELAKRTQGGDRKTACPPINPRQERLDDFSWLHCELNVNDTMDWMGLYNYPTQLLKLQPGDVGVFLCPPAWRGRLGTVCGIWVKGNTDWAHHFPPGTPWTSVFWTEAHAKGLRVVRAPLPGQTVREQPHEQLFAPATKVLTAEPDLPQLDRVVSLWRTP